MLSKRAIKARFFICSGQPRRIFGKSFVSQNDGIKARTARRDRFASTKMSKHRKQASLQRFLFSLIVPLVVVGCSQRTETDEQIDACVKAGVKAREPYPDDQEKARIEAGLRAMCQRAAAPKT